MDTMVRGLRNNNPGNIRKGKTKWEGLAEQQTDSAFCVFTEMKYGIRALYKILKTYHNKYGLDTIEEIIGRWAPENENDTNSYVNFVASYVDNVSFRDKPLNLNNNPHYYTKIAQAIAKFENGNEAKKIPDIDWAEGKALAGI